jgi:hypothetical protein
MLIYIAKSVMLAGARQKKKPNQFNLPGGQHV